MDEINKSTIVARKQCKRHMTSIDEYVSNGNDGFFMDSLSM
jgi:hypothetical protein